MRQIIHFFKLISKHYEMRQIIPKMALKRLLSYFPVNLPVGMTAYAKWEESLVELIGPIATVNDLRFCIASEVIRLGPNACSISKNYIVRRVRAGAAKQIAGAVFTDIKNQQIAAQKAELEKQKQGEATADTKAVSEKDGVQQA